MDVLLPGKTPNWFKKRVKIGKQKRQGDTIHWLRNKGKYSFNRGEAKSASPQWKGRGCGGAVCRAAKDYPGKQGGKG